MYHLLLNLSLFVSRSQVVEILTTALLEEMLKKLCLPSLKYKKYLALEA
jgi:hypothetical protein